MPSKPDISAMVTDRNKLTTLARTTFLVSLCAVAGCAGRTEMPPTVMTGSPAMDSAIENPDSGSTSSTVTIVAPRPLTTPGVVSIDPSSLLSPLGYPGTPAPPITNATNPFAGLTSNMPHKLMLGSAPTPTPDDLCVYGSIEPHCFTDAARQQRKQYISDPGNMGHFREMRPGDEKIIANQILTQQLIRGSLFWLEK